MTEGCFTGHVPGCDFIGHVESGGVTGLVTRRNIIEQKDQVSEGYIPEAARGCSRASLAYGEEMMDDQGKPSRETLQGDAPETMGPRPERNRIKDITARGGTLVISAPTSGGEGFVPGPFPFPEKLGEEVNVSNHWPVSGHRSSRQVPAGPGLSLLVQRVARIQATEGGV
ncbi:unnamed protein product [Gadus morhua 'NCC']